MPAIRLTHIFNCQHDAGAGGRTVVRGGENISSQPGDVGQGCTRGGLDFQNCQIRNSGNIPNCCFKCNASAGCQSVCRLDKILHSIPVKGSMDIVAIGSSNPLDILREDLRRQGYELTPIAPRDNGKRNPIAEAESKKK